MGKIVTPKFRIDIELDNPNLCLSSMVWDVRTRGMITGKGKPNKVNLAKWVENYNADMRTGDKWNKPVDAQIIRAWIVNQYTDEIVATWELV